LPTWLIFDGALPALWDRLMTGPMPKRPDLCGMITRSKTDVLRLVLGVSLRMAEDALRRKGTDPFTFAVMLTVRALTASLVPALKAMRVDPTVALRHG
jgi:hypothetical protein